MKINEVSSLQKNKGWNIYLKFILILKLKICHRILILNVSQNWQV